MMDSGYVPAKIGGFHRTCLPYLGELFFPDKNANILDIGAGAGHGLIPLQEAGWKNLWALDIDDFAEENFLKHGIKFSKIDVSKESLPFEDNFFDAILSFHLIEHLTNTDNYLEEARRVLKENGKLILVTPNWRKQYKTFWRDHTHVHPYDKESIVRAVRCHGLKPVFTKDFGVMRGIGKTGLWKFIKPLMFTGIDLICVSQKS